MRVKVGELARRTGLTVRTLHHWEERGLVVPSRRTAAGHRLYDDRDVRRVYEVVALRELGLSLEEIGDVLAPERDRLEEILSAHLAQVEARLAALRDLHTRLAALVTGLHGATPPGPSDLMELIDEVSTMTETFTHYFTDSGLYRMRDENAEEVRRRGGPTDEQIAYVRRAGASGV